MFAIVIATPDEVYLARDPMGIKPLYYWKKDSRIIFASEIKALLKHRDVKVELDEIALAQCAVFGYVLDAERTCFKGIQQVPPGTWLRFDGYDLDRYAYYNPRPSFFDPSCNFEDASQTLMSRLKDAASVMVNHGRGERAIYLSGGIDSSIMTALLVGNSKDVLHTFTLADTVHHDDYQWARKVSEYYGTNHHEYVVSLRECLNWLPHFIYHFENPMLGGVFNQFGSLAFHILSSKVGQTARIGFCGEGADELFGGYYWLHTHPLGFADRLRARAKEIDYLEVINLIETLFPVANEDEELYQNRIFDLLIGTGLSNCHLWSVDRSSSAFSFEARPLYLHNSICEFALAQPVDIKAIKKEKTKLLLRTIGNELFAGTELAQIVHRQKMGMPAAIENIAEGMNAFADGIMQRANCRKHPLKRFFTRPLDRLLFDLFTYIFISRSGNNVIPAFSEFISDVYGITLPNSSSSQFLKSSLL